MMTWWLVLISRSRSDSATTGLGTSGYQSLSARLLVMIVTIGNGDRVTSLRVSHQSPALRPLFQSLYRSRL